MALTQIYLSDHSAMMTAELELVDRCRKSNESIAEYSQLAQFLKELCVDIEEEQDVARRMLDVRGGSPNILKEVSSWAIEKIGRLKFNGHLTSYSDLSRVLELEILLSSAQSRKALWTTAFLLDNNDAQNQKFLERTQLQMTRLAEFHTQAIATAFRKGTTS